MRQTSVTSWPRQGLYLSQGLQFSGRRACKHLRLSTCGSQTRSINIPWESIGRAKIAPTPVLLSQKPWGRAICSLTSPSSYSDAHESLRTTVLKPQFDITSSGFQHWLYIGSPDAYLPLPVKQNLYALAPSSLITFCVLGFNHTIVLTINMPEMPRTTFTMSKDLPKICSTRFFFDPLFIFSSQSNWRFNFIRIISNAQKVSYVSGGFSFATS